MIGKTGLNPLHQVRGSIHEKKERIDGTIASYG
jgi:hypothetical protein